MYNVYMIESVFISCTCCDTLIYVLIKCVEVIVFYTDCLPFFLLILMVISM